MNENETRTKTESGKLERPSCSYECKRTESELVTKIAKQTWEVNHPGLPKNVFATVTKTVTTFPNGVWREEWSGAAGFKIIGIVEGMFEAFFDLEELVWEQFGRCQVSAEYDPD
jgi:hypothetical protein